MEHANGAAVRPDGEKHRLCSRASSASADDNALAQAGQLPDDPAEGAEVVARPVVQRPAKRPLAELAAVAFNVMSRRASGQETPLATPWPSVNKALRGGFWPGLYTLTSATGMGKTQWALQVCLNAGMHLYREACDPTTGVLMRAPDRVAYVALELGPVDLVARVLGIYAAALPDVLEAAGYRKSTVPPWHNLYHGRDNNGELIPDDVTATIAAFEPRIQALPLDVETGDAIGWSYLDLRRAALPLEGEGRTRLLVLDYSQLVSAPEGRAEELRQTIGNVAKVARDLARKGLAVLALCSTARSNYDKILGKEADGKARDPSLPPRWIESPEVMIDLGKESGDLEFTADVVMALARRPAQLPPSRESPSAVDLVIAKGRGLPVCCVPQCFDGSLFGEADEVPRSPVIAPPRRLKAVP